MVTSGCINISATFLEPRFAAIISSPSALIEPVFENTQLYLRVNAPFYFVLGLLFTLRFSIQSVDRKAPPIISSTMELACREDLLSFSPLESFCLFFKFNIIKPFKFLFKHK